MRKVNKFGHLEIGGCDLVELKKKFGTPLYILDEDLIRSNCQTYRRSLEKIYPQSEIIYAGKANLSLGLCKVMSKEGLSLDVSSGGELYTALKAKFPLKKIYFHSNNKSEDELKMALRNNIGRIVVDNSYELSLLSNLAQKMKRKANILLRLTPGVKPKTHTYIQTGQIDSKFGLGIEEGEALRLTKQALDINNINLCGIHCHIGSQILKLRPFLIAAETMVDFLKEIKDETGRTLKELNLGGGLGIRYTKEDSPPSISKYAKAIAREVIKRCRKYNLDLPRLMVEPGRSIVGEAGTTLYKIGSIKDIPNIRRYVAIDGGMTDNPRPALYSARYEAILANKARRRKKEIVTIVGKCCESGDVLIWDIKLPRIESGDLLAVLSTGAYNYSMASNYNRLPRPATVLVRGGRAKLIVRRETYEDIIKCDLNRDSDHFLS